MTTRADGIVDGSRLEFWQCIGMLVAMYGLGYLLASQNLHQLWPIVLVGLLGKLFGPIGTIVGLVNGLLPSQFLWVNVTNDLIWLPGFTWVLAHVYMSHRPKVTKKSSAELTLYQRVLGAKYERLSPRLVSFMPHTRTFESKACRRGGPGRSGDIAVRIRITNSVLGLLVAYSGKIRPALASPGT